MLDTYFSGLRALKEHRSSMLDTHLFQVPSYGNFPGTRTKRVHGSTGGYAYIYIDLFIYHGSTCAAFVCMGLYSRTETVYDQHSSISMCLKPSTPRVSTVLADPAPCSIFEVCPAIWMCRAIQK